MNKDWKKEPKKFTDWLLKEYINEGEYRRSDFLDEDHAPIVRRKLKTLLHSVRDEAIQEERERIEKILKQMHEDEEIEEKEFWSSPVDLAIFKTRYSHLDKKEGK